MTRVLTVTCCRCGCACLERFSVLQATAGPLSAQHDEAIDLCRDCGEKFQNWLRGARFDALPVLEPQPDALLPSARVGAFQAGAPSPAGVT